MRKLADTICLLLLAFMLGCSNSEVYDNLPSGIQRFLAQYYPNEAVESFTFHDNTYQVIIKDGPTIDFDSKMLWTSVDGNGSVLPQVLLFNDFPPALYAYLQETQNEHSVFAVTRNSQYYKVKLLTTEILYDISSNEVTGESSTAE